MPATRALTLSPCGRGWRELSDLSAVARRAKAEAKFEPGEGSLFVETTPHPVSRFARNHPLPQGERVTEIVSAFYALTTQSVVTDTDSHVPQHVRPPVPRHHLWR